MSVYGILPNPESFPGVSRVFRDMEHLGMKVLYVSEQNIYKAITESDLVIFGAYHELYAYPIRRLKATKFVLWTSPLLQMELSNEIDIFDHVLNLKDRGIINQIWFGDLGMWKAYESKGFFMPYPLDTKRVTNYKKQLERKPGVTLFCPWSLRKNILTQLAAMKIAQKDAPELLLYGNNMGAYAKVAERMGVSYVDCGWMKPETYFTKIQEVHAGLQVFLSESFAYTALDHILLDTPVLGSPSIDWLPQQLKVANIDDPVEIADRIIKLARDYSSIDAYREAALDMAAARNARVSEAMKCRGEEGKASQKFSKVSE